MLASARARSDSELAGERSTEDSERWNAEIDSRKFPVRSWVSPSML